MADRELRIRMLLEAADKITKPMREAAGGSLKLSAAMKETRGRMKELQSQTAKIESFRTLKSGLAETTTQLATARTRTTELGRALAAAAKPTKEMTRQFNAAKREVTDLEARQAQQHGSLTRLRSALTAAGVSTKELASHERRLKAEVAATTAELAAQQKSLSLQQRFAAARSRFSAVQGTATGLAAGGASAYITGRKIIDPLGGAVSTATEYDSQLTDINQKLEQSRKAGYELGKKMRAVAIETNQSREQILATADTLAGLGADKATTEALITPIGKASTAYKANPDDLAKTLYAGIDNLKIPKSQGGRVLDSLAKSGKEGAFELKDMATYLPSLTAGMARLGATGVGAMDDLGAAAQAVKKTTGTAGEAATNLDSLLNKATSKEVIKNFKNFGIDIPAALKKAVAEGKSPLEELALLSERATGGDQSKLTLLFGNQQSQAAVSALITHMDEYRRIRDAAANATGTVNRDFAERMKDPLEKIQAMRIAGGDLKLTLGEQLLPAVADLAAKFTEWGTALKKLAERHPGLTKALALTAGIAGGLFLVFGGLAIVLAGLMMPFAMLAAAATALGVGFLPIIGGALAVAATIGVLITAGYALYKAWNKGFAAIASVFLDFSPIGLLYRGVSALLGWLGVDIPARLSDVGKLMIKGLITGIKAMWGGLKSTISGIGSTAITALKEKLGIHSPSRVFAALGGHMMAGLDVGLARGSAGPLSRLTDLSTRLSGALVAGGSAVALTAAAPVAASAPPPAPVTYHITINAPSAAAPDIAEAVRQAIADMERQHRGRRFGDD